MRKMITLKIWTKDNKVLDQVYALMKKLQEFAAKDVELTVANEPDTNEMAQAGSD